jgi:hypothetical protein
MDFAPLKAEKQSKKSGNKRQYYQLRREKMKKAMAVALTLGFLGFVAAPLVYAEGHPMIRKAQKQLENAKSTLQHTDKDFGGHRVAAIPHIDEALNELNLALAADHKLRS